MKKKLSFLLALLVMVVTGAWADTVVLTTPSESVTTLSDANGIVTITDATGSTGIQQGSGSYKMTYDGTDYVPMKLSGSRNFTLSYKEGVTISKVTLLAMSNGEAEGTVGAGDGDATSLGTFPARNADKNCLTVDITGKKGLRGSRQFLVLIVVEYSTTEPGLTATPSVLTFALNPSVPSKTQTFTIKGQNLMNGVYDLTIPNVDGLTVSPTYFEVENEVVNQEVQVTYASTADVAKAETTIGVAVGELSANVAVSYQSRATAYTQSTVSTAAAWDWSKLTETVELTDESTPTKSEEFLLADLDDRINFTEDFGDAKAIKMEAMQFPSRAGFAQGTYIKFKTSVAGKISVDFSNTGGGDRPNRYLNVNGVNTEFASNTSDKVSATDIAVPAGDVVLMGNMVDEAGEGGFTPNMLRWYKITFTPTEEPAPANTFSAKVAAALAAPVDGVATLTLDADYEADAAVNVPLGTQLVIDGANHTLTLGEATNFVLNDNITLKNVKIDATALTSPLIALTATPADGTKKNQDVYTDAAATDFNLLNAVTVENVMVKNLKVEFISSNGADWALENFSLTKSIIQLDATGKKFIAFDATANNKGAIKNITISENTIYNINETSNAYFIRFANASNAAKAFGTSNGTSTFDYKLTKNTIVNTFKAQNFGNNTPNNAKTTIEATQNIFADVKNVSKFVQNNCTKTVEKNVAWGEGAEASISEIVENPVFTAPTAALDLTAENGGIDLHVGASTLAAKNESGDPRWVVPYVEPKLYIIGNMNGWNRTAMTEMTFNAETQTFEYEYAPTTTVYLAFADYQMTEDEAAADADWTIFNSTYRYAIGENDQNVTLNSPMALLKVNGSLVLQPVKSGTSYKISVAKDLSTVTIAGEAKPILPYVVAGSSAELFGTAWDATAEANAMTLNATTGNYEITYSNVTLSAGNIEYKVVKNGSTWLPEGENLILNISEAGSYNVTFTINPNTNEITGVASSTSGINAVKADALKDAQIYTISGQRVDKAQKGLYIVNGRKVVVK